MSRNCTRVLDRIKAGSINVCRAGSTVALHFGTPEGELIITMRERDFVTGARAGTDHNGNPFRTIEQFDAEKRLLVEALDGATPEATK